jgi:hypothetical protein
MDGMYFHRRMSLLIFMEAMRYARYWKSDLTVADDRLTCERKSKRPGRDFGWSSSKTGTVSQSPDKIQEHNSSWL